MKRIGIIGAGAVTAATVSSLIAPAGIDPEIIIVNRTHKRAVGLAEDFTYAAAAESRATVRAGSYADLAGADLVIITAGVNEKDGGATDRNDDEGRRKLIPANARAYIDMIGQLSEVDPKATVLVVTDPPDPLASLARRIAPEMTVLSSGTTIDSLRFRYWIGRELGVPASEVDAVVLGEHGTSAVYAWSSARVGGRRVLDLLVESGADVVEVQERIRESVKYSNISIIEGIGASQHGIGSVVADIAEAIVGNSHAIMPVASYLEEFDTFVGMPTVLGREGVVRILRPELTEEEQALLEESARVLREADAVAFDALER
ncbi:malate dehydrogenase [Brevibacterium pityocampae]|uniref:L-lactate dehydrogenase n=1 Tax=Brevibacterium pityocampae TaxID=506594 RepID=A0ABP8J7A2_9MICO